MILNDLKLRQYFSKHCQHIGGSSIDLTLDGEFKEQTKQQDICFLNSPPDGLWAFVKNRYVIPPSGFCLAGTRERIKMPSNMAGIVTGRSSFGRLGLSVETAGFVDAGFDGHITLEIVNHSRNRWMLTDGDVVAQLIVFEMTAAALNDYSKTGRYNGQRGATESKGI